MFPNKKSKSSNASVTSIADEIAAGCIGKKVLRSSTHPVTSEILDSSAPRESLRKESLELRSKQIEVQLIQNSEKFAT